MNVKRNVDQNNSEPDNCSYDLDGQVGYLLRLAHQRHTSIFQKHTIENLTPTQFSALIRISQQEKVSQNHLGRLCGMDVATVKGVVQRLENKKLVNFSADPDDKRRTLIALSSAGSALIDQLEKIGKEISAETLAPLSTSEQEMLIGLLEKIS